MFPFPKVSSFFFVQLGLLSSWDYSNQTKYPGECGRVHGSYGEEFPPDYVDKDVITVFANDLCRLVNHFNG